MGISLPFYPLAFVHGYVDGVSLSISMIWFSLSGGGLGERKGVGSVGGWFCGLFVPQSEGNEWGKWIFTTTTKKCSFTARFP